MAVISQDSTAQKLASRLGNVHAGLREDIDTTRHLFRGQPSYIIRDPLTFQSHRFDLADYEILVHLDESRPLSAVFEALVARGRLKREDEESFYEFILFLHRVGYLNLPVADGKLLYRRHKARQAARRRRRIFNFMFLKLPVWNPDAFLDKTVALARLLFHPIFFLVYLTLLAGAGLVAVGSWRELAEPLNGLLAADNLLLIWLTLVGLKTCHEFGHAFACKHFGLHVPEMGIYLVAGVPCAYVDASAAWGLTQRSKRVIIGMAGMYVESIIAALATLLWAMTGPSLINSTAYNIIFLAGVVTVVFNINPLLRYDGYFVLSDLVEIPNLAQRASRYLLAVAKHRLLGIRSQEQATGLRLKVVLFVYGIVSPLYRVLVLLAITALLASKLLVVGLFLGGGYLLSVFAGHTWRLTRYLWCAEETAPVRYRAVALSLLMLVAIPATLVLIPFRTTVHAPGIVSATKETVVRADAPGFLLRAEGESGETVALGCPIATLGNDTLEGLLAEAAARLEAAEIRRDAYRLDRPALAIEEDQRVRAYKIEVRTRRERIASLRRLAPVAGRLVACVRPTDAGKFIPTGGELARIISGTWEVRALLSQQDISAAEPGIGDAVEFRAAAEPDIVVHGVIERIDPYGDRLVSLPALTQLGSNDIIVEPLSGEAFQPYFLLVIRLAGSDPSEADSLQHGMTGRVRLRALSEPLGLHLYRRVARFLHTLE